VEGKRRDVSRNDQKRGGGIGQSYGKRNDVWLSPDDHQESQLDGGRNPTDAEDTLVMCSGLRGGI